MKDRGSILLRAIALRPVRVVVLRVLCIRVLVALQRGACKRVHVYESVRPSLSEGLAPLIHVWAGLQFKGRGDSLLGVDVLGRKSGVLHAS